MQKQTAHATRPFGHRKHLQSEDNHYMPKREKQSFKKIKICQIDTNCHRKELSLPPLYAKNPIGTIFVISIIENSRIMSEKDKEILEDAVNNAEKELENVKIADEVTDIICEECGRNMVIKYGPHGKFLACPGFPDCRNTKPYLEKIGVSCPQCGKDIVIRKSKKGRKYYGCEDNPTCDFMSWQKPTSEKQEEKAL